MSNEGLGRNAMLDIFEQGKRFTEELLKENENLRLVIAKLKTERREIESQLIKVEVPRLQQKVEVLESELLRLREENRELKAQFDTVEEENRQFADRYVEVEKQNSDLISLYVASHQLHSTLNYEEVVRTVRDIVINLVGTEKFGIYLVDEESNQLVLTTQEGLEGMDTPPIPLAGNTLGEIAARGEVFVAQLGAGQKQCDDGSPIACIPLKTGDETLGAIIIYELLVQKDGFAAIDYELFEMLGNHAASAIYASRIYTLSERKRATLKGFLDLMKEGSK